MRNFVVVDEDQRSDAWRLARVGRLTGSRAKDMLATIKTGESAARRDLRMQLVCGRLTGHPDEDIFANAAIQRGIDCEPLACAAYECLTGHLVQHVGFLVHPTLMIGCSPDGCVDDFTGIIELKCPKSATHFGYLRSGGVPAEHLPQILHNLWVTGAEWCDFLSWDDRFPEHLQTFLVRVERDDKAIAEYAAKAKVFLDECDREVSVALGFSILKASA